MSSDTAGKPTNAKTDSDNKQTDTHPQKVAAPSTMVQRNDHATPPKEQSAKSDWERVVSIATLAVLFLTFLAAGYAGCEADRVANYTKDAMDRADTANSQQHTAMGAQQAVMQHQLEEMQAEQRPWLKVLKLRVLRFRKIDNQLLMWPEIKIQNVGHAPARLVTVFPELSSVDPPESRSDPMRLCERLRRQPWPPSAIVYPNDTYTHQFAGSGVAIEALEGFHRANLIANAPRWHMTATQTETAISERTRQISFVVVGCVIYEGTGGGKRHATPFEADFYGPAIDISKPMNLVPRLDFREAEMVPD